MSIFWRLFLWFCGANMLTLAVSLVIAGTIARHSVHQPPDVAELKARIQADWLADGDAPLRGRDGRLRWYLLNDGARMDGGGLPPWIRHRLPAPDAPASIQRLHRGGWLVSDVVNTPQGQARLLVVQGPARRPHWFPVLFLGLQVGLTLIVIAAVGWWVSRRLATPLQHIQSAARGIADGALDRRVGSALAGRSDEYGRLARDFDHMATQVQSLLESRDQLLHDVSHELRAPLSRLRFAIELSKASGNAADLDRADREIGHIDTLVGQLLALARLEHAGADAQSFEPLALWAFVNEIVEAERPAAQAGSVELSVSGEKFSARAEADSLRGALENLLANALRFAPAGSQIQVCVSRHQGHAQIAVRDQGPGVPQAVLHRLFEPFFRVPGPSGQQGYGIGLALVSRVMRRHGGSAQACLPETGGLEVRLRWPIAGPGAQRERI